MLILWIYGRNGFKKSFLKPDQTIKNKKKTLFLIFFCKMSNVFIDLE